MIYTAPEGYEDEQGFHCCDSKDWEQIYRDEMQRRLDDAK
jgi:hypothetical protein